MGQFSLCADFLCVITDSYIPQHAYTMAIRKSVLFVLLVFISVVVPFEKRADDVDLQSLMTLVQQQAVTIQSLQAQLTSLQTSVHQHSSSISYINANLSDVNTRLDTRG